MANSLTVQVRAISDVATAVAEGDLTRSITVEAQGEVSALKDNVNRMIGNLKTTTQLNDEQDWLKSNLARFFAADARPEKSRRSRARLIMSELTPLVSAHHGAFYIDERGEQNEKSRVLALIASYAFQQRKSVANRFMRGEGLGRTMRARKEKHSADASSQRLRADQFRPGTGDAAQYHRAAGLV